MDQRIIDLYDSFTHGGISRRVFLDRLAHRRLSAVALLPLLQNDYARAAVVAPTTHGSPSNRVYDAGGARIGCCDPRPAVMALEIGGEPAASLESKSSAP